MQRIGWNSGVVALVAANMVPLFGVGFFDWSLSEIVFLYWTENIVVGIFNVAKMYRSTGSAPAGRYTINGKAYTPDMKKSIIIFSSLFYFGFTLLHGTFMYFLFGPITLGFSGFLCAFGSLLASHGVSFWVNFINWRECERVSPPELLVQPYERLIVLHLMVILGGSIIKSFGAPLLATLLLVILKIGVDVAAHVWEHRKFSEAT